MNPYLLVNGNFVRSNGMDLPNLALASYLAECNEEVHLVTHYAEPALARHPNVRIHHVPKVANSYFLSAPFLNRTGRRWAAEVSERGGHVVVNGGNCVWGDVNWVHYVHAAFRPTRSGGLPRRMKNQFAHKSFLAQERASLRQARIVITNSNRTRRDVIEHLGVPAERVHTVYYGIDAESFRPPTEDERTDSREALGWAADRPVVAFVGAIGDRRKGLDTLFAAWQKLCASKQWDADLAVVGTGTELPAWKSRAVDEGLVSRIHFLGFRTDVPRILAACDALVAPTRYDAYGQGVHEALCRGLPALVSKSAGVAERYSADLQDLLISDPENVNEIVERLRAWHTRQAAYSTAVATLSIRLRAFTWTHMAEQVVRHIKSV